MGSVFRKSTGTVEYGGIDRAGWRVPLVLSAAVDDHDGDLVHPGGFLPTSGRLYANLEHDQATNHYAELKSLGMRSVTVDGKVVPVLAGWSHFDRDNPEARQVFGFVEIGALPGFSVEFEPSTGTPPLHRGFKSVRLNRPAYEFRKARLLGGAHCEQPVCPLAGVVLPDRAEVAEKALRILKDRRIGGEALLPSFAKAFSARFPARTTVTVPGSPVTRKSVSMDPTQDPNAPPLPEPEPPVEDAQPDDTGTPPTAKAAYDAAQGCEDLANAIEEGLKASEHMKGKAKLMKLVEDLRAVAEEASAVGDMVTGDVSGKDKTAPDPDGKEPPSEPKDDDEPELKAIRKSTDGQVLTQTGYKPRRFHASDLKPAPATQSKSVESAEERRLARQLRHQAREIRQNIPKRA